MYSTFSKVTVAAPVVVLLSTIACGSDTPVAPTPPAGGGAGGGSTLKATAPIPESPVNNQTIDGVRPTLRVAGASGTFVSQPFSHQFEVYAGGSLVSGQTVSGTSWELPSDLQPNAGYQWRARAVLDGVFGPWSDTATFRTFLLPGCVNGLLVDPRAYFFHVIGRSEGSSAAGWQHVLLSSGIPAGHPPGVRAGSTHYGFTQQIRSSGEAAGRLFLPTNNPDQLGYFTRPVNIVEADGSRWIWVELDGPAYAPRPCP